ncbi:MAG: hypothetical protein CVV06_14060 [Gammaproteobacteria bacterium HGW-Gammaproteobacteria-10]|nr:MAG: hypothetical protein CVV13_14560 [Gammaproteobacteria bacterium HGW-Gammaproteobacteria-3]PKM35857.1 MAG: hypothetical protein CVV06_14060 [Gammaproteobacteria bacterium HGW-Gammaproteobacteria-10]
MQLPQFLTRPSYTCLYITEAKTFRIDTDRRGIIKGKLSQIDIGCEKAAKLPAALKQIIAESPLFGRKVWLLYVRLDTYALSLPSVQVAGVNDDVLEQALSFEYEALTGKSMGRNQLAYRLLGADEDMSHYWVNLLARETLAEVLAVLKKSRCRLAGLAHPGGLPLPLSKSNDGSWLRLECWSNTVFMLAKTPEQGFSLQIIHKEQNPQWQEEVNHWFQGIGAVDKSETILNNQLEQVPATDESYWLTQDGALIFWLGLWIQHAVGNNGADIPLLNKKTTLDKELMYSVGSGVGALILCAAHFTWMLYQTHYYEDEFEQLTRTEKEIKALRDGSTKSQVELSALQTEMAGLSRNADSIPKALAALKRRPADLLRVLSQGCPSDVVIESIERRDGHLAVTGVSLRSGLPNQLASILDKSLAINGWKVNSPTKKNMELFAEDGPWAFEIVIEDAGLKSFIDTETSL